MHPGAENFRVSGGLECAIPATARLRPDAAIKSHRFVIGVARQGERRRGFVKFLYAARQRPARMIFLVNDWYWKDKSNPLTDLKALVDVKKRTGVPIDSFTFDDGWSTYTDTTAGLWGKLDETRFSCDWQDFTKVAQSGGMSVSLWFGPIGGYGYRPKRLPMAKQLGFEIYGDKLCLAGTHYNTYVRQAFQRWARQGMDYIKVDGFWPNCPETNHGHAVGPGGTIAQMDALADTFASWRTARPDLLIGYTSGSNPSPFWLLSADYLWRGGADDAHQGVGTPADRYTTFVDRCLQLRRGTEVPISAFVTFDLISRRILPADDATLERCFWWSAARGSLNHDWYLHPADLTDRQWQLLGTAANWAKNHLGSFRFSRMIGKDVTKSEVYGFASFDGHSGTLALRNPADKTQQISGTLAQWLELTNAERKSHYRITHVYGQTKTLAGTRDGDTELLVQLPATGILIVDVVAVP